MKKVNVSQKGFPEFKILGFFQLPKKNMNFLERNLFLISLSALLNIRLISFDNRNNNINL